MCDNALILRCIPLKWEHFALEGPLTLNQQLLNSETTVLYCSAAVPSNCSKPLVGGGVVQDSAHHSTPLFFCNQLFINFFHQKE